MPENQRGSHKSNFRHPESGREIIWEGTTKIQTEDFDWAGVERAVDGIGEQPTLEGERIQDMADALRALSIWIADGKPEYWGHRALVVFWMLNRSEFGGVDTLTELAQKVGATKQFYSLALKSISAIAGTHHFHLTGGLNGSRPNNSAPAREAHKRKGHNVRNFKRPEIAPRVKGKLLKAGWRVGFSKLDSEK